MKNWLGPAAWNKKEAHAGDRLPYACHIDASTLRLRDGSLMRSMRLAGFPFETEDDGDFDGLPDDWSRRKGPEFPSYVKASIDPRVAALAPDFRAVSIVMDVGAPLIASVAEGALQEAARAGAMAIAATAPATQSTLASVLPEAAATFIADLLIGPDRRRSLCAGPGRVGRRAMGIPYASRRPKCLC